MKKINYKTAYKHLSVDYAKMCTKFKKAKKRLKLTLANNNGVHDANTANNCHYMVLNSSGKTDTSFISDVGSKDKPTNDISYTEDLSVCSENTYGANIEKAKYLQYIKKAPDSFKDAIAEAKLELFAIESVKFLLSKNIKPSVQTKITNTNNQYAFYISYHHNEQSIVYQVLFPHSLKFCIAYKNGKEINIEQIDSYLKTIDNTLIAGEKNNDK